MLRPCPDPLNPNLPTALFERTPGDSNEPLRLRTMAANPKGVIWEGPGDREGLVERGAGGERMPWRIKPCPQGPEGGEW